MTVCFVRGVSVFGPGLPSWAAGRSALRGEAAFSPELPPVPLPTLLAPNERRRSGLPTRLAFAVGTEATAISGLSPASLPCIFASSNGEGAVVHGLLECLAGPDRHVSPTQFHNSVHNAVAGYWSIGTCSMQPVTCLACHDWTFATALVQAVASCRAQHRAVLLCVYDAPIPLPLGAGRHTEFPFAVALVLSPEHADGSLARLRLRLDDGTPASDDPPRHPGLRALVPGNAAARSLRLLESLARQEEDRFLLGMLEGCAAVELCAC
jgi:hypothetical protein